MLLNRRDLRDRMIRLVGHGRLNLTTQALDDAATRISRYLLMQLVINVIYGISVGIGLWIIGADPLPKADFPNVLLWALLAAVLRFVPLPGPDQSPRPCRWCCRWRCSTAPASLLATLCMYLGIELVMNNVLEPWLYGSSTGLSVMAHSRVGGVLDMAVGAGRAAARHAVDGHRGRAGQVCSATPVPGRDSRRRAGPGAFPSACISGFSRWTRKRPANCSTNTGRKRGFEMCVRRSHDSCAGDGREGSSHRASRTPSAKTSSARRCAT